jgi:hypothetical protein
MKPQTKPSTPASFLEVENYLIDYRQQQIFQQLKQRDLTDAEACAVARVLRHFGLTIFKDKVYRFRGGQLSVQAFLESDFTVARGFEKEAA